MIHFARPEGSGTFCGNSTGDVRWHRIRVPKHKACPACWRIRESRLRLGRCMRQWRPPERRRR